MFPSLFRKLGKKAGKARKNSSAILELTELERRLQEMSFAKSRSLESKKAKKYIVEQLLARGFKKTEIAARLGISRTSVYNILNTSD